METQKFIVTSKRNDYLYAYHTEYGVGDKIKSYRKWLREVNNTKIPER